MGTPALGLLLNGLGSTCHEAARVLVGCPLRGASCLASCISEAARGCPDFVAGSGFAKPSIIGYWPPPISGESYMTMQLISGPTGVLRVIPGLP